MESSVKATHFNLVINTSSCERLDLGEVQNIAQEMLSLYCGLAC